MEINGGFLVTKIKQLGDRIFEKILSEKKKKKILMRLMELKGVFFMCCGRRMVSQSGHSRSNAD